MTDTVEALKPCPFCGSGLTLIHVNKGTWNGNGYGEPISVEVRHWCEKEDGQPERMISRIGRDRESAIAAWNRRALAVPEPHQQLMRDLITHGLSVTRIELMSIYASETDPLAPSAEQKEEE